MTPALLAGLEAAGVSLCIDDEARSGSTLRAAVAAVAAEVTHRRAERVLVPTRPDLASALAVLGGLAAGALVVPVDGHGGERELGHQVADADPDLVLHPVDADVPAPLAGRPTVTIDPVGLPRDPSEVDPFPPEPDPEQPALVIYTSGTTGPPKGAVLSRRAVAANLDALATVWEQTPADTLVHSLPLYHVHGLVLGVLGPIRLGGRLRHTGRFSPGAVAAALAIGALDGPTVLFAVPTLYARLADAMSDDGDPVLAERLAGALADARLLVSGSAGLPGPVAQRLIARTGQTVIERYGTTETCIITAVPAADRRTGTVGPPLPGTEVRIVDEAGHDVPADDAAMGELWVRSPSVFSGYRNQPEATATVLDPQGWFHTGDLATVDGRGWLRIVGRRATDLIKSGGFKIGAGEVEAALLDHPAVAEAAVKGLPDDDLGERVAAWVVLRHGVQATPAELAAHVAATLVGHKRPREVFLVDSLPRNAMGKVVKSRLAVPG